MANIVKALNAEIRRLARRESKLLVAPLHKALTLLRREIWRLNRDNRALAKKIQESPRSATGLPVVDAATAATGKIGPRLIAKLRKRLDLSQGEFAALLDVSANSISNWETGSARPNADMRSKLIAARQMGRREVKRLLKEKTTTLTAAKNPAPKGVKKAVAKASATRAKAPKTTRAKKAVESTPVAPAAAAKAPEVKAPTGKRGRK